MKLSLILFFVSNVAAKQDHKSAVLLLSLGHQKGDTVSQESLFYGANKSWNRTYNSAVFEGQNVSLCFSLKDCQFVCFRCVTLFAFPRYLGCTERKGKVTLNDRNGGWSWSWEQGVKKEDRNLGSTPPDLLLECGIRCANKRFHSNGSSGRLPRSYSAPCVEYIHVFMVKKKSSNLITLVNQSLPSEATGKDEPIFRQTHERSFCSLVLWDVLKDAIGAFLGNWRKQVKQSPKWCLSYFFVHLQDQLGSFWK